MEAVIIAIQINQNSYKLHYKDVLDDIIVKEFKTIEQVLQEIKTLVRIKQIKMQIKNL